MDTTTETKPKATDAIRELAERHGQLTPDIVVDAARPKESPLHRFFQWNNGKAAEQYRLIQASCLIRRVKVTYQASDEKTVRVRAFVNVTPEARLPADEDPEAGTRGIYVSVSSEFHNDHYRDEVIAQCMADVEAFRRKYSALKQAQGIIEAMDGFTAELSNS